MLRLAFMLGHQLQQMPHKPPVTIGLAAGASSGAADYITKHLLCRTQHPLRCLTHARARPCPKAGVHSSASPLACWITAMVAIFMGFVDAVPSVRSACLQPYAILEVGSASKTTDFAIMAFRTCARLQSHKSHQRVRDHSCTYVRRGHADRAVAASLLVGAAPRR